MCRLAQAVGSVGSLQRRRITLAIASYGATTLPPQIAACRFGGVEGPASLGRGV